MSNVQYFDSTMAGMTNLLERAAGSLINVMDAFLINGSTAITLDSLVVSSGVATATYSSGHGFVEGYSGISPWIRIAGVTDLTDCNGDTRITITSASQFTFTTTAGDGTASGTITAKVAPLDWTKEYSGTNKAAYRAPDLDGTRHYLRIDDGYGSYQSAQASGYETMSDVDTGTHKFPSSTTYDYVYKSNTSAGTYRKWWVIGDGKRFYMFLDAGGAASSSYNMYGFLFFGDIISLAADDLYHSAIISATSDGGIPTVWSCNTSTLGGGFFCGNYAGTSFAQVMGKYTHKGWTGTSQQGEAWPSTVGNLLRLAPQELWEGSTQPRGYLPGAYACGHNFTAGNITDVAWVGLNVGGKIYSLLPNSFTSYYGMFMDITGPW